MHILILTALPLEFTAVSQHVENRRSVKHESGTLYEEATFRFGKQDLPVLLCQTGAGNTNAAIEAERAIAYFRPSHVFFVGVAGGLKDVMIGDVVAATKVYGYESGKAEEVFRPRPDAWHSSYEMVQHANRISRETSWKSRIVGLPKDGIRSFVGPIAAGEKVIASTKSATYALLKAAYGDALAVEMEGFGALSAVYASKGIESLDVRGISDVIDGKANADAGGSQEQAAANAAAFAFEIISSILALSSLPTDGEEFWRQLEEVAIELYPRGPDDSSAWSRAGGDLSLLTSSTSPRGAWHNALKSLRLGGGGKNLTKERLVRVMQTDFAAHPALKDRRLVGAACAFDGLVRPSP